MTEAPRTAQPVIPAVERLPSTVTDEPSRSGKGVSREASGNLAEQSEAFRDGFASPADAGPPSSATPAMDGHPRRVRARSATPRLTVPHYCRVKGCGRRIVKGRLGFLEFVHAERVPFPHYARV